MASAVVVSKNAVDKPDRRRLATSAVNSVVSIAVGRIITSWHANDGSIEQPEAKSTAVTLTGTQAAKIRVINGGSEIGDGARVGCIVGCVGVVRAIRTIRFGGTF